MKDVVSLTKQACPAQSCPKFKAIPTLFVRRQFFLDLVDFGLNAFGLFGGRVGFCLYLIQK